jgi:hypothetical protein
MNDPWNRASLPWWPSTLPLGTNLEFVPTPAAPPGGLLGDLGQPSGAWARRANGGGVLGILDRRAPPPPAPWNAPPPAHGFYFSPVPQAPSWNSVPARADGGAAPISPQPPSPASWDMRGVDAVAAPPADEVAAAQDAFRAAAERVRRGVRGRTTAPEGPPAPDPEAEADEPGEPGLIERIRLNGVDAFYRGSLTGAGRLALMQHYASTPDEPGVDAQTSRWRDQLRREYPQVLADLARYDRMRGFATPAELAAAAIGQVGGGLPSPESLVGMGAKGATWLWRLGKAGLQQGAVTAATDPLVQGLNVRAGVQDESDPARTAVAAGTGVVTGAAARSMAEVLGRPGRRTLAQHDGLPDYGSRGRRLFGSPSSSFHYTFGEATPSIAREGLLAGSYATPTGTLSPLQAHIDLALPPNRGLPEALIRVDLAGLRRAGYEMPAIAQVGRSYGMPGGGYEMRFPYDIPPQFIKVIRP